MLTGTVVENSLIDLSVLSSVKITRSWDDGSWRLHAVSVEREQALQLGAALAEGPWYMHFWNPQRDGMLIIFRDAHFDASRTDKSTWDSAIAHGRTLGIPDDQLDFVT